MSLTTAFIVYSLLVIVASLAGGWVPILIRLTHRRMQIATSLIAGFMLGVALLHLLPHALLGIDAPSAMLWVLAGLLTMFFLERFFAYHHHTAPAEGELPPITADPEPVDTCAHEPGHPIDHAHGHAAPHAHQHEHTHKLSWAGIAFGLIIHSLVAGASLAAVMKSEVQGHTHLTDATPLLLPGLAVFLVIVLHRPFDSMTLLTLLKTAGFRPAMQHIVNVAFALAVPLGGVLFFLGVRELDAHNNVVIGSAVAFAAGVFLCVSLADLLPEVHFHRHDRLLLSATVLIGLAMAWAIAHFESQSHAHHAGHGMQHDHGSPAPAIHDDHGHDHEHHDGHDHDHGHDHGHEHDHDH